MLFDWKEGSRRAREQVAAAALVSFQLSAPLQLPPKCSCHSATALGQGLGLSGGQRAAKDVFLQPVKQAHHHLPSSKNLAEPWLALGRAEDLQVIPTQPNTSSTVRWPRSPQTRTPQKPSPCPSFHTLGCHISSCHHQRSHACHTQATWVLFWVSASRNNSNTVPRST